MGLFRLDSNQKKNFADYLDILPPTLDMISGGKLIAIINDKQAETRLEKECANRDIALNCQYMAIDQLPYSHIGDDLLKCCKRAPLQLKIIKLLGLQDRGRRLYKREYKSSGEDHYKSIIPLWMSKIPLVLNHAVKTNPHNTQYSAWMDCSVSRFNNKRQNWNFADVTCQTGKVHLYGTKSFYKGRKMQINASFQMAKNDIWPQYATLFDSELRNSLNEFYPHDDETILNRVVTKNPALFSIIGDYLPSP